MLGEPSICFELSVINYYIFNYIIIERVFLRTVLYAGEVNYGETAIRNVFVIVSKFVINGAFY